MGELIFFAVLILFSILESIARKRKEREHPGAEGEEGALDTRSERRPAEARRSGASADRGERGEAAETMLPADLWEEIAGLASGGDSKRRPEPSPGRPRKPGRRLPGAPTQPSTARRKPGAGAGRDVRTSAEEARTLERLDLERIEDEIRSTEVGSGRWTPSTSDAHPVHQSHREYGADPSGRMPSAEGWRPSGVGNRNAKRVRAMLRGSEGVDALKQAVILQEVLGPPTSMKDG